MEGGEPYFQKAYISQCFSSHDIGSQMQKTMFIFWLILCYEFLSVCGSIVYEASFTVNLYYTL